MKRKTYTIAVQDSDSGVYHTITIESVFMEVDGELHEADPEILYKGRKIFKDDNK